MHSSVTVYTDMNQDWHPFQNFIHLLPFS